MLSEDLKDRIREAYNSIVVRKSLSPRWGQRQMIAEVANTLARVDEGGGAADPPAIAAIEAGTGTGKTVAYCLPGILMARALGKRLVIATATVALQEQLAGRDLPDLQAGRGLEGQAQDAGDDLARLGRLGLLAGDDGTGTETHQGSSRGAKVCPLGDA